MALESSLDTSVGDGNVTFAYAVENTGSDSIKLMFTSGQRVEVVVRANDQDVWRYSDGKMFTQAIEPVTLDSGESFTTVVTWENPDPGTYEARATLAAQEAEAPATQPFTVTA